MSAEFIGLLTSLRRDIGKDGTGPLIAAAAARHSTRAENLLRNTGQLRNRPPQLSNFVRCPRLLRVLLVELVSHVPCGNSRSR